MMNQFLLHSLSLDKSLVSSVSVVKQSTAHQLMYLLVPGSVPLDGLRNKTVPAVNVSPPQLGSLARSVVVATGGGKIAVVRRVVGRVARRPNPSFSGLRG